PLLYLIAIIALGTPQLAPAARPVTTSTIGVLSDRELLRQTTTLVRHERHLQGAIIDHLTEIEARRLFLRRGCSSLFDYAVRELGYSDAAAGRRIGAVRLCADQPGARERLRDGSLTLSAAAELQWAFDRQRRRGAISGTASTSPAGAVAPELTASVADLPGSAPAEAPELGGGALGAAPAEVAPAATSSHSKPVPPLVLDAAGRQKLVEEATGKSTRQVRRMLADLDPELTPPADRVRPLGDGRYELKAVIDADCQQGLEHLRGLLSHVDPRMTMGQLVGRIVQEALDRHDPSRPPRRARTGSRAAKGVSEPAPAATEQAAPEPDHAVTVQDTAIPAGPTPAPERTRHPTPTSASSPTRQEATDRPAIAGTKPDGAATSTPKPCAAGRAIPAAVKRQVWQRDGGRCSYLDRKTGRRCNSRHLIEIDHIMPYALGGGADPGNLRLLCRAHHRHRHEDP
ncbi:MAG: HNH endonuclease, partial [Spirochaetaceae bacterium]|nr:HNH endonuclease [Spirochaetaceae bacterium]